MKEKIKILFLEIKYYLNILSDFKNLNRYIKLSSIFCSRVEQLLSSNLSDSAILDNIKISYSSFKADYDLDDFTSSVEVKNNFER